MSTTPEADVFIQWKGTDVCLDFRCLCGAHGHVHGMFVYGLRCGACGRTYQLPHTLTLREGPPDNDIVVEVRVDSDETTVAP